MPDTPADTRARASADTREVIELVERHVDLVDIVARQMRRHFGPHMTVEELASYGHEALILAARSFDADKGIGFKRWASIRVRGAMLDAVRMRGNLPRRVWQKLRALQAADEAHETALEELAAAPPATPEEADARIDDGLATAAMAMAISMLSLRRDASLERARDPKDGPEDAVARAELLEAVRSAIEARPEPERTLMMRHYFEDVSLEDAGRELGLSKSWASRLHTRALEGVSRAIRAKID